jgi:hypothetical protein
MDEIASKKILKTWFCENQVGVDFFYRSLRRLELRKPWFKILLRHQNFVDRMGP